MYKEYWRFQKKPFENTPDPLFLYHSEEYEEAFARLMYAVTNKKGGALLTGEYGAGKTLLSRTIINSLTEDKYEIALITNPNFPPEQLVSEILYQLGSENINKDMKIDGVHAFNDLLYKNYELNKNTIIIIDEAQLIEDTRMFEEIRLLLNFQLNDQFLLTLILMGQPELKLKVAKIPQFKQRISISYHLIGLSEKEVSKYIKHRLTIAGTSSDIFKKECFSPIYSYSKGIPRVINNICDLALFIGFNKKIDAIDKATIMKIIDDLSK